MVAQCLADADGAVRLTGRSTRDLCRSLHLLARVLDRPDQACRGRCRIAHRQCRLFGRSGHLSPAPDDRACRRCCGCGLRSHPLAQRRRPFDRAGDMLVKGLGLRAALRRHLAFHDARHVRCHHVSLDQREPLHHIGAAPHARAIAGDPGFDQGQRPGMGVSQRRQQHRQGHARLIGRVGMSCCGDIPGVIERRGVFHLHVAGAADPLPLQPAFVIRRRYMPGRCAAHVVLPEFGRDLVAIRRRQQCGDVAGGRAYVAVPIVIANMRGE